MAAASAQAPPVAHAIGGSLGSALALLLFYPLERARIQLQSEASRPKVYPALDSFEAEVEIPEDAMSQEKQAVPESDSSWMTLPREEEDDAGKELDDEPRPVLSVASSSESSSSSVAPMSTRTKQKRETLLQCLVQLHKEGELYTGVSPVVSTILTSQFVFFYMHAVVKGLLRQSIRGSKKSSAALSLVSSCLAGLGNVLLTNPLWVVNMAIVTGETRTGNLWRELYVMVKERGFKYMWNGTSASVLLVSNPVIQFFCYEQMKVRRLVAPKTRTVLLPIEAFFFGAIAKGAATVTTYPLQLAQTVLRLKDNKYRGTFNCLIEMYKEGGIEKLFTGMRAKLLQTVLTAAFTFLTYEQILGAVQATLTKRGR